MNYKLREGDDLNLPEPEGPLPDHLVPFNWSEWMEEVEKHRLRLVRLYGRHIEPPETLPTERFVLD